MSSGPRACDVAEDELESSQVLLAVVLSLNPEKDVMALVPGFIAAAIAEVFD